MIDRYDINGYFTKVELTEQKLYTLVKAGVREVHNSVRHYVVGEVIDALIANAGSTEQMSSVFGQTIHALREGADGRPTADVDPRVAVVMNGKVVANSMDQGDEAVQSRSRDLAALPGTPVGPYGDRYVVDKGWFQLTVAKSPSTVEARYLAMTTGEIAEFMAEPYHRLLHAAALLWKQAQAS